VRADVRCFRRRDVLLKQPKRILLAGLAAGALSVLAYGLVLWAQTRGALARSPRSARPA
jgi:hypothetical protein